MTEKRLPRLLVLIGSGETAPRMTRVHRSVIRRLAGPNGAAADVTAVVIDTPFGFQENADELSTHLVDYFGRRLGMRTGIASYRRRDVEILHRETALARVGEADFVFSGPGSPSYAIRQWQHSAFGELFSRRLRDGGALVFASAAALTIGRLTVPVYEIYKAGEDPHWLPGLDVLGSVGISAAIIPHFDNNEGSGHDTRFCFLGERRFRMLEEQLPDDVHILGIDEHTALLLDLDQHSASVRGRGKVTVRHSGASREFAAGSEFSIDLLRGHGDAVSDAHGPADARGPSAVTDERASTALARRTLELEKQVGTLSERADRGDALVEALIDLRRVARERGDYQTADSIRKRLAAAGVELRDDAAGSTSYRSDLKEEPG